MLALNRAIEKAFEHSDSNNNIQELLECMGEELGCSRISIFEENEEGNCDNSYEWCRRGVMHEQVLLQDIAISQFDSWYDRLVHRETILVRSPEELKESDPDVYRMFVDQQIHRAIVTLLAFHGKNFGFCILEDPSDEVMGDHDLIMPGIRYILSSMIYSRNLVARLRRLGYTDTLTGAGNRVRMQENLEQMNLDRPLGVICVDVAGWDDDKDKLPHLEREQTLLRTGEVLLNLFDEDHVFRVTSGEFILLEEGGRQEDFERNLKTIRGLMREHNLLAAVTGRWEEKIRDGHPGVDRIIHGVLSGTAREKERLLAHRRESGGWHGTELSPEERANIDMPRGDEFFRLAEIFLARQYEGSLICIVTDINYFKLYNDIFGRRAGNVFLENLAEAVQAAAREYEGICGYTGGDNFCLIVPSQKKELKQIMPSVQRLYDEVDYPDGFAPAIGVYFTDDHRETMVTLYDRALGALAEIKGDYIRHINYYSAEMHLHQREDRILLMQIREGLAKGEFIFYIQPQVNERTEKIIGGEALARWIHDGKLINPGQFIPILEKTGYIYTVDTSIWEAVAAWQRSLIDRGIRPVPISVNVSRVDFYFGDIAQHFIDLIEKYDLDPSLIGVEITESAFTDNNDTILEVIQRLRAEGFRIMMDDFGRGSSSLSMLHTMHLDVLKTDVMFMSRSDQNTRAISIVESIISMAHMMGMTVVTEGVETAQQRENLIALGDSFAQGFYFYRPMPKEEFEALIMDHSKVDEEYGQARSTQVRELSFRDMIREGLLSDTLLSNILRAAAVYQEDADGLRILQMNEPFSRLTGIRMREEEMKSFEDHLDQDSRAELRRLLEEAGTHHLGGSEGSLRLYKDWPGREGETFELSMRFFKLYSCQDHTLYMSTMN